MKGLQQQVLAKYKYQKDKPIFTSSNYNVYIGTTKQNNLAVTIKTLKYPHVQLGAYLQKVKQCKSQNVIKIYELSIEQQFLIVVTEQIIYGTLKKALENCKYLDQPDAIFMAKQMLSGHTDLLRQQINWFGNQDDIEFAQDGQIKLSWNNGCSYNLVNPFPVLIQRFSNRSTDESSNSILPFPLSKSLEQLIRISKQNASQISMSPQMKKKQKIAKKKGKNWIGIRQYKNKNQYFDEFSYFGVHSQHGFIRAKINDLGKVSPNHLQFNKTKSSFTKIYQMYDQGNKTITISDYSNDGNLQAYVTRLKTAGIKLKEDQIQFFVYSLLQPIKLVQDASLKAICMLHIKNIWIQSGIPKIGQPIPLNQKIEEVLADRKEVPDFYHSQFKAEPTLRQQRFDTYSLGVLLYKMMYTQMPIFPQAGKVHIPTAPTYNKRLKQSVELFLTNNSSIRQIEEKIEMSEQVKKQIEDNRLKMKTGKAGTKDEAVQKIKVNEDSEQQQQNQDQAETSSEDQNGNPKYQEEESDDQQGPGCYENFKKKIQLSPPKKIQDQKRYAFVDQLELSSFKNFRIWSKCVIIFVLYVFLFYYHYIQNSVMLLASQGLLTKIDLNISGKNVSVITTDRYQFQKAFNKTGQSMLELQNMNCLIQDPFTVNKYSGFLKEDSPLWYGYVLGGLGSIGLILLFKAIQLHTFDDINAWFRKQQGQGHFNITNWFLLNLHWLGLISGHYFLFHFGFQPQTQPCMGHKNGNEWGSTNALFNDHSAFIAPYVVIFGLQAFFFVCYLIMIGKNVDLTPKYNKILNTVSVFGLIILLVWLIIRLGIILKANYYPAGISDSSEVIVDMIQQKNYVLFFAILPEFLFLLQFGCICGINWIYYAFIDKTNQRLLNSEATLDASLNAMV